MKRVELKALYPRLKGEDVETWSDRLLSHAGEHGTNRQCSIGWHEECSDPNGYDCRCLCHDESVSYYTVEGHAEGSEVVATRVKKGQHRWPPKPGEPATAWGEWILARSKKGAERRAIAKVEASMMPLEDSVAS